jgi:hypothetical protein
MAKLQALIRMFLRSFAAFLGLGFMAYLVFRTGPETVWKQVQSVGWGLGLIIFIGGCSQLVKTCAWRQAFVCDISGLSWWRSFVAQLVSDAIGQVGLAGKLIGEGIRISFVGRAVPLANRISSSAIDGALHGFTAVLITVSGITAALLFATLSEQLRLYALPIAVVLMAGVVLAGVAVTCRWPLVGDAARAIGRVPRLHKWISGKQPVIDSAEQNLLTFYQDARSGFWANLMLNLLWHVLAILEVYIILRYMGMKIAPTTAFVAEAMTKVINLVGVFNPGNFGTYEAGNMLIAKIVGVTGTGGLTLALCRRARAVFWAGVAAICMMAMKRAESTEGNGDHATCHSRVAAA